MNTPENNAAAQPQRDTPPLPGGGSWTFDEHLWQWVDNNPAPTEQAAAAEPAAAAPTEAPAADQPLSLE